MPEVRLPLRGVRVLELGGGTGELATRYLADLGADVVLVEGPEGSPARRTEPVVDGRSTYHGAFNANKRSLALDLSTPHGRSVLEGLLEHIDIVFSSVEPARLDELGLDLPALVERYPHLVLTAFTPFGLTGPWRDWTGSERVHLALGSMLSRSGAPGREPLMPPGLLALQSAAVQAAWATLVAFAARLAHGQGDLVDVAALEAVVQVADPAFGMAGSAAGGMPTAGGPRGRVDWSFRYPYYEAADGWVRVPVLSPRQWAGMYEWLGRPSELAHPDWSLLGHRYDNFAELRPWIAELLGDLPRADVISQAARYGIPAASVLSPDEVLAEPHFAARGVFRSVGRGPDELLLPDGAVELDGARAGLRAPAPMLGEHTAEVLAEWAHPHPDRPTGTGPLGEHGEHGAARAALPLAGVRVLDLGVIVAGGEAGRLLADLGAEVLKVENRSIPDGSRQSIDGSTINVLFAWGNRSKRSIGIDAKSPRGAELLRGLVAQADVILSNFKPGTLQKLGLEYDQLTAINPGVIVLQSSAFGHTGPWAANPGYGPVVRAAVGVSHLWRYHDDPSRFFDDVTSYPDHAAARVAVGAVLARLIDRRRSGVGGSVHVAQTEVSLWQHSHLFAAVALEADSLRVIGNVPPGEFPAGLFAGRGDDEWVVVDTATTTQRDAVHDLLAAAGFDPGSGRAEAEVALRAWLAITDPDAAVAQLQELGVPAARMRRPDELLDLAPLVARSTFRVETHPLIAEPMPSEGAPALYRRLPRIDIAPAPVLGQHTREIAGALLGLDDAEIDELIDAGILQEDRAGLDELARALETIAPETVAPDAVAAPEGTAALESRAS